MYTGISCVNLTIKMIWFETNANQLSNKQEFCLLSFLLQELKHWLHRLYITLVCLFVCLKFFASLEKYSLIWRFFSWRHLKGCKLWHMLGTNGHWAVRVLYTDFDKRHPFIIVISEDPWHSHVLPSVWQWSSHYLFLRLTVCRTLY